MASSECRPQDRAMAVPATELAPLETATWGVDCTGWPHRRDGPEAS
ncbi:MAG: hypothetical protein GY938_29610 [Ketobacter sp.]|nr:hypothetical protein [Ketobacter sp.]